MYCRRDILECLGNLSFKEFSRIRRVSRVLSGIRTGGRLSNPKGALVDRLIANELGPEGIVRDPDDGAKDEARGVVLSSSIGSSGDSSREEASKGKCETGWFSVILI